MAYTLTNLDGTDDFDNCVSSGVYLYRVENGAESITNKMMLIR